MWRRTRWRRRWTGSRGRGPERPSWVKGQSATPVGLEWRKLGKWPGRGSVSHPPHVGMQCTDEHGIATYHHRRRVGRQMPRPWAAPPAGPRAAPDPLSPAGSAFGRGQTCGSFSPGSRDKACASACGPVWREQARERAFPGTKTTSGTQRAALSGTRPPITVLAVVRRNVLDA